MGSTTDLLLLATVLIWAFNITVTRYVLQHGFRPLTYASLRYGLAALLAAGIGLALEGTLRVHGRRAAGLVALAAVFLWLNQICFVYSLKLATATTVSLVLGTTPIFAAALSSLVGLERVTRRFWVAAAISMAGVALVALGAGGQLSADLGGDLLAVGMAATWAAYSVCITPLMRTYSPYRISGLVLLPMTAALLLLSVGQLSSQHYGSITTLDWLGLAFAVVGPLILTNVLWFTAIGRVGPARATLFANLQPFIAVVFAVALLSETLSGIQIAGGVLIAIGIGVGRVRSTRTEPVPAPVE
jgi:drug/metabolite transporter (DMT)-like permease